MYFFLQCLTHSEVCTSVLPHHLKSPDLSSAIPNPSPIHLRALLTSQIFLIFSDLHSMINFLKCAQSLTHLNIYCPLYNTLSPKWKPNPVNRHKTAQNSHLDTEHVVSNRTWPKLNYWASPLHPTCLSLANSMLLYPPHKENDFQNIFSMAHSPYSCRKSLWVILFSMRTDSKSVIPRQ